MNQIIIYYHLYIHINTRTFKYHITKNVLGNVRKTKHFSGKSLFSEKRSNLRKLGHDPVDGRGKM